MFLRTVSFSLFVKVIPNVVASSDVQLNVFLFYIGPYFVLIYLLVAQYIYFCLVSDPMSFRKGLAILLGYGKNRNCHLKNKLHRQQIGIV